MSTTHKPTLVTFRVFLIQCTLAGLYRVQRIQISNIRLQTSPTLLGQKTSVGNWNIMPWTFTSHGMLLHTIFRAYLQCQTPRFSWEPKISGPNNVWPHTFRARLQYQAPTMSDPTLIVRDYNNIRLLITLGDTFECHFLGNISAEQFYKPTYQPFWGVYLLKKHEEHDIYPIF